MHTEWEEVSRNMRQSGLCRTVKYKSPNEDPSRNGERKGPHVYKRQWEVEVCCGIPMSSPKCIQLFAIQTNSRIYQFSENIKIKGDENTLQCYIKEELK